MGKVKKIRTEQKLKSNSCKNPKKHKNKPKKNWKADDIKRRLAMNQMGIPQTDDSHFRTVHTLCRCKKTKKARSDEDIEVNQEDQQATQSTKDTVNELQITPDDGNQVGQLNKKKRSKKTITDACKNKGVNITSKMGKTYVKESKKDMRHSDNAVDKDYLSGTPGTDESESKKRQKCVQTAKRTNSVLSTEHLCIHPAINVSDSVMKNDEFVIDLTMEDTDHTAENGQLQGDHPKKCRKEDRMDTSHSDSTSGIELSDASLMDSSFGMKDLSGVVQCSTPDQPSSISRRLNHLNSPLAFTAKDDQVLLIISQAQRVCLMGRCLMKCVYGTVIVHGYKLTDHYQPFFSLGTHSLLTVYSKCNKTSETVKEIDKVYSEYLLIKSDIDEAPKTDVTLLLLKKMDFNVCDYISSFKYYNSALWNSQYSSLKRDSDLTSHDLKLSSVDITYIPEEVNVAKVYFSKQQKKFAKTWKRLLSADMVPIVIVTGAKNSGKSTYNRYLINTTLNRKAEVCYLECDVGQTEFTPPGCVSLHTITRPVFGPPFTHQNLSRSTYYFGGLSAGENPDLYIECIQQCIKYYRRRMNGTPLIINTMGWLEALGLELLNSIIRIALPTHVVQLNLKKTKMNCEPLTHSFINSDTGWVEKSRFFRNDAGKILSDTYHNFIPLESVTESVSVSTKLKAFELRDLAVIAYMAGRLGMDETISRNTPFGVPWKEVALHICKKGIPTRDDNWMSAIMATVVALCHCELPESPRKDEEGPVMLHTAPICPCLGFGMVRGIDVEKKLIYITTPLSLVEISRVNTLIRGSSNIPDQIIKEQIKQVKCVPYITSVVSTASSANPQNRKYIPSRHKNL